MKRKVAYVDLLKEALSEYDTKQFTYKGPLTEPIISYDGDGEMETNQNMSDLLDKYYLKEKEDTRDYIDLLSEDAEEQEPDRNEIVDGEEPDSIDDTLGDFEDEILGDGSEGEAFDADDVNEGLEKTIIERIIREMEDEVGPDNPIEPEKDEETKEAGTEFASPKEIDKVLEDIELELALMEDDATEEAEKNEGSINSDADLEDSGKNAIETAKNADEPLDVDKKVTEQHKGMGPIMYKRVEDLEEQFRIFREQVEEELGDLEDKKDEKKEDEDKDKIEEALFLEDDAFLFEDDEEIDVPKDEEKGEKEKKEDEKLEEAINLLFEDDEEIVGDEDEKKKDEKKEDEEIAESLDFLFEDDDVDVTPDADDAENKKEEEDEEDKKLEEAFNLLFEDDEGADAIPDVDDEKKKEDKADEELEEAFNLLFEDDDVDLDLDFNPKQKIKKSKRLIV